MVSFSCAGSFAIHGPHVPVADGRRDPLPAPAAEQVDQDRRDNITVRIVVACPVVRAKRASKAAKRRTRYVPARFPSASRRRALSSVPNRPGLAQPGTSADRRLFGRHGTRPRCP